MDSVSARQNTTRTEDCTEVSAAVVNDVAETVDAPEAGGSLRKVAELSRANSLEWRSVAVGAVGVGSDAIDTAPGMRGD